MVSRRIEYYDDLIEVLEPPSTTLEHVIQARQWLEFVYEMSRDSCVDEPTRQLLRRPRPYCHH